MDLKTTYIVGLNVRYIETSGQNDIPLIILHGWASHAMRWEKVLYILEAKNIRAIALDFPGRGGTSAPDLPWGLDDYVKFVMDFIAALHIEKFYLLGHSFGGRVAIKIAALGDTRLVRLILLDAAGVTPRDKKRIFIYKIATKIGGLIFSLPLLRIFRKFARKIIYFFSGGYDFYVLKGSMRETFSKIVSEDLSPLLYKITAQTHIIWGEMDRMTPLSDAHLLHKKIKDSKLTIIPGGSHSFYLDMPERLAQEISQAIL